MRVRVRVVRNWGELAVLRWYMWIDIVAARGVCCSKPAEGFRKYRTGSFTGMEEISRALEGWLFEMWALCHRALRGKAAATR